MIYTLAILGNVLHVLKKLIYAKQKKGFLFSIFMSKNWLSIIFGLIATIVLCYVLIEPISQYYLDSDLIERVLPLTVGWSASSLLNDIVKIGENKIKQWTSRRN